MAKIIYHTRKKSVFLSHVEAILCLASEFGVEILDAFFPAKYPETHLTRRLLGLDTLSRKNVHLAKYRLIQRGLVAKRRHSYTITPQGEKLLQKLNRMFHDRKLAWDRKWRIVVFDIPETKKAYREALRRELTEADYRRLQDSVWIGKHPLSDDVFEFIEECNLTEYVHLFLAAAVDREEKLNDLFSASPQSEN